MIYLEIIKAKLEENSDPRIARFCFILVFFMGKRTTEVSGNGASELILCLNALNYLLDRAL